MDCTFPNSSIKHEQFENGSALSDLVRRVLTSELWALLDLHFLLTFVWSED
mgnify:CR=1 FL=1